ncbi:MAG: MarR family winged helix-turn-helix transcriptional regulator [Desulfotignum sp.]
MNAKLYICFSLPPGCDTYKHLLKRTPHRSDRRAFLIELTPEGEACFREHHEFHLKMTRKIVSGLTPLEQQTFADVIEKILKKS